ncbi:Protein NRT1/PTR FAMILY 5.10 [Abeliophyllum distichum]|uniref:Protein NRT1/PTR FAMILY 5.10 n=1 Tax=Abeliophyllum distichum TaxID=126358 RepID=A0ABD1TWM3_9LAMI
MSISSAEFQSTENGAVDDTVGGMLDYAGRPAKSSTSGYWRSAYFVIGVGVAEKFAYFGISSNIITYLTGPLGQPMAIAAADVNIWSGTGLLLPLLGGFMADSFVGRYRTIVVSSVVYILALGLLTLSAMLNSESPNHLQVFFFFFSLYLVALGQGVHKPCIMAFGADQFDGQDAKERRGRSSFFNWIHFSSVAGPLTAVLILNYIQDNLSWSLGFGIPCISMAVSLTIFLFGTRSYRYTIKVEENHPLWRISRVFVKAAINWRTKSSTSSYNEEGQETAPQLCSQQFKFLNKALLAPDGSREYEEASNVSEIEEAKTLLRLIPMWATSLGYAIVLAQISTLFTEQGVTMDRSISSSIDIPAASLQCLIGFSVVLLVPIYDCVFVPIARSITGSHLGITKLQRIGTGMVLCILSMVIAALVERKRLETARVYGVADSPKAKVPMSFWWLVPQYILCGMTNIFAMIGLQELFYDEVPCKLKSIGLSFFFSIFGIGEFLSSFLISIIDKLTSRAGGDGWFSSNANRAHLDYFYWLLAGLNALGLLGFLYFSKSYNYIGDQGIVI